MIPVYICDDEKKVSSYLAETIQNTILIQGYSMEVKGVTDKPAELLENCDLAEARGIYFLDVDLKDERYNGFTLAQEIRKKDPRGYIVFITTHGELALETFRYKIEAMDYILKDQYEKIGSRILECLHHIQEQLLREKSSDMEYYTVKVFDEIYSIPVSDILYFETSLQKHRIILQSDETRLEYFGSLQAVGDELGEDFLRTHRSYLVNKKRIRSVHLKKNLVEMDNGDVCLLSRTARNKVKQEMKQSV